MNDGALTAGETGEPWAPYYVQYGGYKTAYADYSSLPTCSAVQERYESAHRVAARFAGHTRQVNMVTGYGFTLRDRAQELACAMDDAAWSWPPADR